MHSAVTHASNIPSSLTDLLAGTATGVVLAVFERSAYLDVGGRIVALASGELGRGPLTIRVDDFSAVIPLAVGHALTLHDGAIDLGHLKVNLRGAAVWDPALLRASGMDPVAASTAALELITEELRRHAPSDSIVPLLDSPNVPPDASLRRALLDPLAGGLETVAEFLSGRADASRLAAAIADRIAGRGLGLTPSGDDLLTGIMHAITVWPHLAGETGAAVLRRLIADAARPHTTRISGAYLDAAADGLASEPWHDLVRSVGTSHATIRAAVRRVLDVGETSGADALTGFCWAWRRVSG